MFEKSLVGAYCNRLYDLKERQDSFSCYGRIKANSAGKNLNVTNSNTKAGLPNCRTCLPSNSSFLYESKRPPFWATPSVLTMFHPPYTFKSYEW